MKRMLDDLVALCRHFGMFEREQVCCGTVTVQQCVVLQALLDGPSDVGPLADRVGSSPSTMTRLLDGLAQRGWVDRVRDVGDRRRVQIRLTPSGAAEAARLRELTAQAVDAVIAAIPRAKRAQVRESLGLLRRAVEDARDSLSNCCG